MAKLAGNPVAFLTEYELGHLVEHLAASGRGEDLHRLLALDTSKQRNAWYEAKKADSDLEGYLSDMSRAWRSAQTANDVGMQLRYALCFSSVAAMSDNIPVSFLRPAVEHDLLSPVEALTLAQAKSEEEKLAAVLETLAPVLAGLQGTVLHRALTLVQDIRDENARAWAVEGLAPHLPEELMGEALAIVQGIRDADARARVLVRLALHLPDWLMNEALSTARELPDQIPDDNEIPF